jgi:hypothetical protein
MHQTAMIKVIPRSKPSYRQRSSKPYLFIEDTQGSPPPSASGDAVVTGRHGWSPHSEDACRDRNHGPSRAGRLSQQEEQR